METEVLHPLLPSRCTHGRWLPPARVTLQKAPQSISSHRHRHEPCISTKAVALPYADGAMLQLTAPCRASMERQLWRLTHLLRSHPADMIPTAPAGNVLDPKALLGFSGLWSQVCLVQFTRLCFLKNPRLCQVFMYFCITLKLKFYQHHISSVKQINIWKLLDNVSSCVASQVIS